MGRKRKRQQESSDDEDSSSGEDTNDQTVLPLVRSSDEPINKKSKWINKQRVLVLCGRGVSYQARHIARNLLTVMPHTKTETKFDRKDGLPMINEVAEMKNCNNCIFFDMRKKKDLYLWMSCVPGGPSVKFLVENVHTMEELKMTGNCLKTSRPLLSFDPKMDSAPHLKLLKEMLTRIFGTPRYHPKSQPFIDHVFNFTLLDGRIWFRNYQIIEEDGQLAEVGPRFALNPIKIFDGSFGGETIYENPSYESPNWHRAMLKKEASYKYQNRKMAKMAYRATKPEVSYPIDETEQIFAT